MLCSSYNVYFISRIDSLFYRRPNITLYCSSWIGFSETSSTFKFLLPVFVKAPARMLRAFPLSMQRRRINSFKVWFSSIILHNWVIESLERRSLSLMSNTSRQLKSAIILGKKLTSFRFVNYKSLAFVSISPPVLNCSSMALLYLICFSSSFANSLLTPFLFLISTFLMYLFSLSSSENWHKSSSLSLLSPKSTEFIFLNTLVNFVMNSMLPP